MLGKILPILLAVIGLGAGIGAGVSLRPEAKEEVSAECPPGETHAKEEGMEKKEKEAENEEETSDVEFVKLNNQFVVPVVADDLVDSLVVLSLSVEIESGQTANVYSREPKLRDAFLQVLFDHANFGGFQGEFTNANNMDVLRSALTETARNIVGDIVKGILITDIARQDV